MQIQVELQDMMGSDRSIAEAAWTSSTTLQGKTKRTDEDVARVVRMLIEHKHASPIEAVVLRFWIKMPIAIDRQHMTHRIASHNGMSGRYRTMPDEFLDIPDDVQTIIKKLPYADNGTSWQRGIDDHYKVLCYKANIFYKESMEYIKQCKNEKHITNDEYKRCREFLRGVLPQHNMTERITVMNLRSFANYQKLRNSEHAQPEIRQIAELMLDSVKKANIAPVAISVLEENGWNI